MFFFLIDISIKREGILSEIYERIILYFTHCDNF